MTNLLKFGTRYSVLFLILFLHPEIGKAQGACGTPDLPLSHYQALVDEAGLMPSGGTFMTANLPIWFTVVTGNSIYNQPDWDWNTHFVPKQMIEELNGYFSSPETGIQFYLCGIDYLNNDSLVDLDRNTETATLRGYAQALNPSYGEVINVYLVSSLSGFFAGYTGAPFSGVGSIYIAGNRDATTLAHEMGHYLGLPHTFIGGATVFDPAHPEFAQYVNDSVTLNVLDSLIKFTCENTGDGFCDTDADINGWQSNICVFNNNCMDFAGCNPANDPLGVPYMPDRTLLMSTYGGCKNRFSEKQIERMRMMLFAHPSWNFLIDQALPSCQTIGTSADLGYLLRDCNKMTPSNEIQPLQNFSVPFQDENKDHCGATDAISNEVGKFVTYKCVYPYLGTGLLSVLPEVNHPAPLNGVTTGDLVSISKHILGIQPLESPYQLIAADANNSGSVTTFDIVELRKLILGIYQQLPNNSSWRFVPDYCFKDPAFAEAFYDPTSWSNPFDAVWTNPEESGTPIQRTYGAGALQEAPNAISWMDHVTLAPDGVGAQDTHSWSFWGVKVGDVNCTSTTTEPPEEPNGFFLTTPHLPIAANVTFTVQIKALETTPVSAWQMGIEFASDSMEVLGVQTGNSGETFSLDNFGLTETANGKFKALNFKENGTATNLNNKSLFKITMKALKPITNLGQHFSLKSHVLPQKFYAEDGQELSDINLQLEVVNNPMGMMVNPGNNYSPQHVSQFVVYPVPFSAEINFDFELPKEENVEVAVFNATGQIVAEDRVMGYEGMNTVKVDIPFSCTSGFYWYTVKAGDEIFYGKIMK